MNSFLYGMELFQIRMNTFQIGMYSLYVRYSHTANTLKIKKMPKTEKKKS